MTTTASLQTGSFQLPNRWVAVCASTASLESFSANLSNGSYSHHLKTCKTSSRDHSEVITVGSKLQIIDLIQHYSNNPQIYWTSRKPICTWPRRETSSLSALFTCALEFVANLIPQISADIFSRQIGFFVDNPQCLILLHERNQLGCFIVIPDFLSRHHQLLWRFWSRSSDWVLLRWFWRHN